MNMKKPHSANRHSGGKARHGRKFSHRPYQNNDGSGNRPNKNAAAQRDKYLALARDAMASGDRILSEYYLQHADHYTRQVNENASRWQPPANEAGASEASVEGRPEYSQQPRHEGNGNGHDGNRYASNDREPVSGNYADYDEPAMEEASLPPSRPRNDQPPAGLPAFITGED